MERVENIEMIDVKGGAVRWGVWAGIGAFASFMIGVFDGFVHMKKCKS